MVSMGKTKFSIALILISVLILSVSAVSVVNAQAVWNDINPTVYINPAANPSLNSMYMLSTNEGWVVGDSRPTTNATTGLPAILHYDGSAWNLVPAPRFPDFPFKQGAYNLTSVTFGPPGSPISRNDGWTVGFNNTGVFSGNSCGASPTCSSVALHWDGVSWRVMNPGLTGTNAGPLWSAFMVSSTDVWAVGQDTAGTGGVFWHWTGVPGLGGGWNMPQALVSSIFFYSVFMVSSTEGWAVGSGGAIYHYFGGTWTAFASPVAVSLRSVFMNSPTDGWAVGDHGTILHYTGGIWSGPFSPGTTTNNLLSVFMVSSTEGWAVGAAGSTGTILHYAGGTWTALPSNQIPTSPVSNFNFNSVFAKTATDIWTVGTAGVIVHWDGVNWGSVTSPTINNFTSIHFGPPLIGPINSNDGWAVGNASATGEPTIYHWNGFMWTKGIAIGTSNDLNSVFMLSSGDVWTVGGGKNPTASCVTGPCPVILHFNGGSWNTVTPPPGSYKLKSVFMVSTSEGWAVGESMVPASYTGVTAGGIILHYTVTGGVGTWAIFPAPATPTTITSLNSVFMLGPNEGWVVGDNATILHYTVTGGVGTWNLVTVSGSPGLSQDANLTSIFMLSPTSGWAVGGIQASSSSSTGPVIIYWDGTKWTPVATPTIPSGTSPTGRTSALLKSVYCTGPNDCWTGGLPGKLVATLFHWDGVAWNQVTTSPALLGQNLAPASGGIVFPPIVSSIYLTSPGSGWIVGSSRSFTSSTSPPYPSPPVPELSAILRLSSPVVTGTLTTTVVSTVSTSTTLVTSSTVSSSTILTTTTSTNTTVVAPIVSGGNAIALVVGVIAVLAVAVVLILLLLSRRRPRPPVLLYPISRRP